MSETTPRLPGDSPAADPGYYIPPLRGPETPRCIEMWDVCLRPGVVTPVATVSWLFASGLTAAAVVVAASSCIASRSTVRWVRLRRS